MVARFQTIRNIRRGFALVLICLSGFTAAYSWYSWQAVRNEKISQLSLLADLESKSLDSFFGHFESNLNLLSQDLRNEKFPIQGERTHSLIRRVKQANPDLVNINVVRPDGQVIVSAIHPPGSKLPMVAKEASFILGRNALMYGPDFDIGRPLISPGLKEWVIPLRYAVRDGKGGLLYIIQAVLPLSRQQSFWQSLSLPRDALFGLLRDDGFLLSRYPNPQTQDLQQIYGKPRTGALINHLRENRFPQMGLVEGASSLGIREVMVFHRLSWNPLTLLVTVPASQIRAAWWKSNQAFYLLTLVFLVSCAGIYLWLKRCQVSWELEREETNNKIIEVNRAKDLAEKELIALELDDVKLALDHHSIVSITDVSGKITYVNDKFCAVSGYSSGELLGQNHRILNSGLHSKKFFVEMWHTISTGKIWHGQIRNKTKDGAFYWVESTIVPFMNKEGKPYQYVSVRTDVTAFIQARATAEEANRAKSQFLSSMSHELRTPLNSILGFGQLLEMQIEPEQRELHEYVNHILTAGNQLLGLINDLLDLSRIEIGKLEFNIQDVSIAGLAADCVSLVENSLALKKNVTIENTITDSALLVRGDALRVRQVLINLLSNAVKYNRENGRVTLACEVQKDGRVRVQVRDTGMGIASDKLPLLFRHFERIDQQHGAIEGAGIGLYVSKQLVEAMHGEIGAESVKGEGSIFWFVLPAAERREVSTA